MAERRYPHPVARDGVGDSIAELASDTGRLVSLELELLKQEIGALVKRNAIAIGLLAAAALGALFFFIFLQVLIVEALPWHWLAALVITVVWLTAAVVLALVGKSRLKFAGPEATIETIKEDFEWVKQQIKPAPK